MKWAIRIIGAAIGLPILFFASIFLVSEIGGEVVVLHRPAADGTFDEVRVWIVDDNDGTWIEHGDADADWIVKLATEPSLTIERGGEVHEYRAIADPGSHARYHRLRDEKYGWAESYIALASSDAQSCEGTPIRIVRR